MGQQYPELSNPRIQEVLRREEVRFSQTLAKGLEILNEALANGEKFSAVMLHSNFTTPMVFRLT